MDFDTPAVQTALQVLGALGGGGTLVFVLSGWLGKLWADRLMANATQKHDKDLEQLRANLTIKNEKEVEQLKSELEADRLNSAHLFREKIDLYKMVGNPLIDMVARVEQFQTMPPDELIKMDAARMKGAALLAMFGPACLFEEYNKVVDYLFDVKDGIRAWSFAEFRSLSLGVLNLMRADVGMQQDQVSYKGNR